MDFAQEADDDIVGSLKPAHIAASPCLPIHMKHLYYRYFCLLLAFNFIAIFGEETSRSMVVYDTPRMGRAITRGLAYLASQQNRDGSWSSGGYQRHVGIAGISVIALMAGGNLPEEGKYGSNVSVGLNFLLKSTQRDGYISSPESNMYGHGFAALCLAEAYGVAPKHPKLGQKLRDAVHLLLRTQKVDGGWRYNPSRSGISDISVTVCQVQALRAARNSGIKVPKKSIDQAVEYIRRCALPDGSFRYMAQQGPPSLALTGAAVTALFGAGDYHSKDLRNGIEHLRNYARFDFGRSRVRHYYHYAHYYCAQAMFQSGEKDWKLWFPKIRDDLLLRQRPDGSWKGDEVGSVYGTAMAAIVLQIPYQYLPIFQR